MKRFAFKGRLPGFRAASASFIFGSVLIAGAAEAPNGFKYADLAPKKGLKAFDYMEAPAPMPNYIPGAKWGTVGEAIKTMQKPLSPEESQTHIVLQPGFEAKLFATEPDIVKPICMAWDERGRLWIAETFDYPNERQEPGKGRDRIKICEDTDSDGRADKFTIFAENLSIPTSMVFANGGVIVSQPPDMLFLKDTDGDGRADVRQVLFTGWGTADTHAVASNLHWGPDNWIWGVVGYSGFDGVIGGKAHKFQMGFFRFKPDGSELEFIRSSNNNTWGLGLSEEGIVFGSTANNNASMYMPIPNRFYETVKGWSAVRLESIADGQEFYPITEKVRQVDWHHKYTAGAGHELYTARSFPKEYWNRVSFVTEPTGHLIGQFALESKGADFVAHNAHSFLASDDEWAAPIAAAVGPDAALWVIDWYNYIVQHNPTPSGFKTGKGNAYETPLRDKRHGRIYRITHEQGKSSAPLNLANATPQQLVAALKKDNMLWRMQAQRLLIERGNQDVAPALMELTRDSSVDELGLNTAAIHALWTLQGLGALQRPEGAAAAVKALHHTSAGVRRAAVTVLPRSESSMKALLTEKVSEDKDAQVRLAAFLALAEMPASESAGQTILLALAKPENATDRWLTDAITAAGAHHENGFLKSALSSKTNQTTEDQAQAAVRIISTDFAQRRSTDDVIDLISSMPGAPEKIARAVLEGFTAGFASDERPTLTATHEKRLQTAMKSLSEPGREELVLLSQRWGRADLFSDQVAALIKKMNDTAANSEASDSDRVKAAAGLMSLSDKPETANFLLKQVTYQSSPDFANGMIRAVGESRQPETAKELLARWSQLTPRSRRAALITLLRRNAWANSLLDSVEAGTVQKTDLGPQMWQELRNNSDKEIAGRAQRLMSAGTASSSAEREAIIAKLLPVASEKGDVARGKAVFETSCAVCHIFNAQGAKIGPDLTGIGARDRKDILIDILDPNRSVEANYRLWNATIKNGDTISGRLDTETQTSIEILDLAGQNHTIQRKDIEKLECNNMSIMPAGFEALPPSDLAALLEYLFSGATKPGI